MQGFECLIKQTTRLGRKRNTTTATLIDVLLTKRLACSFGSGTFDPALSDYMLIYGIIKEKAIKHSRKVIHFRSYKTFDPVKYENLLITAPWHW